MPRKNINQNQLSGLEEKDAVRRSAPRVAVIFEAIRHETRDEMERKNSALFWSGLAAGLSMGFSFIAEALLQSTLPDTDWRPLISKLGYSIGFLIVILGRQQLFTENTLTPVIHVLREAKFQVFLQALRLWSVVLSANVIGTAIFGIGLTYIGIFSTHELAALESVASHAVSNNPGNTFISAVFAGWLIALMVWLLPAAETARVSVIIIITYLVGLGGFSHIIAGSAQAFYALASDTSTLTSMLGNFFIPTLFGNALGGVAFVAALNYAQVSSDDN